MGSNSYLNQNFILLMLTPQTAQAYLRNAYCGDLLVFLVYIYCISKYLLYLYIY